MQKQRWAVVLAAGSGTRLQEMTGRDDGAKVPKQYCSMHGGPSLLRLALARAFTVVPLDRVLCVVAEQHEQWWRRELGELPLENIIVQPQNRGTAVGTLLPLFVARSRDPSARLVYLPADHYVAGEQILSSHIARALQVLETDARRVILLGLEPDEPDPELGYIRPGAGRGRPVDRVSTFVEKPTVRRAKLLIDNGALWNSFVFAAEAEALLTLFRQRLPESVAAFESTFAGMTVDSNHLTAIYQDLHSTDLSRDVFAGAEEKLAVLRVPSCGWTDLGTPERVARVLADESNQHATPGHIQSNRPTHVNLFRASQRSDRSSRTNSKES